MAGASIGTIFFNHTSTDISTTISLSTTSNDNFAISFHPSLGWFINDNIAIGVMPDIGFNKQKILGKSPSGTTFLKEESNTFNAGIGGFARYYLDGSNPKMRLFGQFDIAAGLGGNKDEGFQYETYGVYVDRYNYKSSGDLFLNTGLSLGLAKFVSARTSFDFFIGYKFSYNKRNPKGNFLRDYTDPGIGDITSKPDYDQKTTGHGVMIGIGFQVFLEKKKK